MITEPQHTHGALAALTSTTPPPRDTLRARLAARGTEIREALAAGWGYARVAQALAAEGLKVAPRTLEEYAVKDGYSPRGKRGRRKTAAPQPRPAPSPTETAPAPYAPATPATSPTTAPAAPAGLRARPGLIRRGGDQPRTFAPGEV
jgi:hypothetical protein